MPGGNDLRDALLAGEVGGPRSREKRPAGRFFFVPG